MKRFPVPFIIIIILLLLAAVVSCSGKKEAVPATASAEENADSPVPNVVPYLDCKPSAKDGQGTAMITPTEPLVAGSIADFQVKFTVGEAGIAPAGFIMLQVSPWWGWTPPQASVPGAPGYTTVEPSFASPAISTRILPLNRVVVWCPSHGFRPGETVTFTYKNARVDRFAEAEELFQIMVDGDGDGHSACIQHPPTVRIVAREPVHLVVNAPSEVSVGKQIEVRAAPVDEVGNWSRMPPGECRLAVIRDGQEIDHVLQTANGGEQIIAFAYTPPEEGTYFFIVSGAANLQGKSNVVLCQEGEPSLKLFFGDIHGHSRMSDGSGTPEDFYRYAYEVSGLDIAALTDHADYGTIPIKGEAWERIKRAANSAYEPNRFVTFLGFEWTNWTYGHRNVYYRDGDGPVFRSIDPESDTPQELWELLKPYEAMTAAHHPGGGPVATNWDVQPGPKEFFVEICSIHGISEVFGGELSIYHPVKGAFVRDALSRGYKLAIVGSGDKHDGHPGQKDVGAVVTGIMGVYAENLTREAVWDAFRRRQVYATSGPKIILNFRVGDSPMGSEINWEKTQGPLPIALRAVCCENIEFVEIIRNGEPVFHEKGDGLIAEYLLSDPNPLAGTSWYYLRVKQTDGDFAWSSPVWVTVE
jgi:hypothetical protein